MTPPTPEYLEVVRRLGATVPTLGPWYRRRTSDGALVLEDMREGEPVVQVYAGLPLALYLEAVAPAVLFGDGRAL